MDITEARQKRDALLEALSGIYLAGSVSWALALAAIVSEGDGPEAVERLGLAALLLRDAAAAPVDPAGHNVVHRERFGDLTTLGAVDASRLLDGASSALALAASLSESRRNVRLATEAWALEGRRFRPSRPRLVCPACKTYPWSTERSSFHRRSKAAANYYGSMFREGADPVRGAVQRSRANTAAGG